MPVSATVSILSLQVFIAANLRRLKPWLLAWGKKGWKGFAAPPGDTYLPALAARAPSHRRCGVSPSCSRFIGETQCFGRGRGGLTARAAPPPHPSTATPLPQQLHNASLQWEEQLDSPAAVRTELEGPGDDP